MSYPPKYRRTFCAKAIELGKLGKSRAQIAVACGVTRRVLYDWMSEKPEFASAMERASEAALAWWEAYGQKGMGRGSKVNSQLWSRSMAARFPDDYRERNETKHEVGESLASLIEKSYQTEAKA